MAGRGSYDWPRVLWLMAGRGRGPYGHNTLNSGVAVLNPNPNLNPMRMHASRQHMASRFLARKHAPSQIQIQIQIQTGHMPRQA